MNFSEYDTMLGSFAFALISKNENNGHVALITLVPWCQT